MKIFCMLALVMLVGFAGLCPASAADTLPPAGHYFSAGQLPPDLLPPPPAAGSDVFNRQVQAVMAMQRDVSPQRLAAIREEQHLALPLITRIVPGFTAQTRPKTYRLLAQVMSDALAVAEADKQFFHTRRPYLTDRHIRLLVDPIDDSPAFPSGHTASMRLLAEVIGLLYPEHREALRARAEDIAQDRVIAGVHFPNDIEGGRLLAMLMLGTLMANSDFQDDLAAAKTERTGD